MNFLNVHIVKFETVNFPTVVMTMSFNCRIYTLYPLEGQNVNTNTSKLKCYTQCLVRRVPT